ncbi:MAG: SpoIIE family protein phosphatase, partial [Mailhella sp.]|nr:SpoIIE family protein phosphatase [Mailhella sp.]
GGDMPLLLFFMPVNEEWMLALASPVADTESGRKLLEKRMIQATQERLESLESSGGTVIAILNSKGEVLAGGRGGPALNSIPGDVLDSVRRGLQMEGESPDGSSLYRLAYFKAMDWYIMSSIPMSSITGPAEKLTGRLLMAAAGLLAVSLLLTLFLAVKLLSPLRLLTEKAGRIAAADLSGERDDILLDETSRGLPVERQDEVGKLALSFVNMARALSQNIRKLVEATAASQRMQGELSAARDIQMGILPPPDSAPNGGRCSVSVLLHPAKEVGGDLYDFFTAPDGRQAVVIGDVSDKGVPAALFMSMTVTLVRYAIAEGLSCAEAMERINDRLAENNPSCMFVTLFIGLFDPATGELDYASGAHCPPFAVRAEGGTQVRKLAETSGPLVGALPGMKFAPCRTVLEPGEYCLLYTDGVSEAMNEAQELFGEDRIEQILEGLHGAGVEEVIEKVMKAVEEHRGAAQQSDDITMLCFKRR